MNQKSKDRLAQNLQQRMELTDLLMNNLNLESEYRLEINRRIVATLKDDAKVKSGDHPLRGDTTSESKELYAAVQRAIASGEKVMKP